MNLIVSIQQHCGALLRFAGREGRAQFWSYVAVVFVVSAALMMFVMAPMMTQTRSRFEQFAREHPEQAQVERGPNGTSIRVEGSHPELMPDMKAMLSNTFVLGITVISLLAAAIVRRLHDVDRSGCWALLPIAFGAVAALTIPTGMESTGPPAGMVLAGFMNSMIYLGTIGWLIRQLALPGTPGSNRYGPPAER